MKLRDQVASLELSRKLEKLGYPQEGLFWWADASDPLEVRNAIVYKEYIDFKDKYQLEHIMCVAPTVTEMGEWLPNDSREFEVDLYKSDDAYWADAWEDDKAHQIFMVGGSDNEANARAKCLIWLVENNYLEFNPR